MRTGNWGKVRKALSTLPQRTGQALEVATRDTAVDFEAQWKAMITGGKLGLKPNAQLTKTSKGSSVPLVDNMDLVKNIRRRKMGKYRYGIAIWRSAKDRDGKSLINIAKVQEHGATIRPRNARALSIPLTRKAKRAGSPRNYPNELTFIKSRTQGRGVVGVLVDYEGRRQKGRKSRAAYILVTSVTIPPRPFRARGFKLWFPRGERIFKRSFRAALVRSS